MKSDDDSRGVSIVACLKPNLYLLTCAVLQETVEAVYYDSLFFPLLLESPF